MLTLLPYVFTSNNHTELCQAASTQWVREQKLFQQVQVLLTHHLIFTFARQLFFLYAKNICKKGKHEKAKLSSFLVV